MYDRFGDVEVGELFRKPNSGRDDFYTVVKVMKTVFTLQEVGGTRKIEATKAHGTIIGSGGRKNVYRTTEHEMNKIRKLEEQRQLEQEEKRRIAEMEAKKRWQRALLLNVNMGVKPLFEDGQIMGATLRTTEKGEFKVVFTVKPAKIMDWENRRELDGVQLDYTAYMSDGRRSSDSTALTIEQALLEVAAYFCYQPVAAEAVNEG